MTPEDPTVIGPTPDDPAGWPKPEPDADGPLERVGDQIGPYRLLELIGEGGFGSVWLAERREPFVQRVALKLIKAGQDTKQVLARFEQERQALAVMNHPGIAKVLDGGATPAGRPYFAMEFVKGRPITEFCDRQKLGIADRLRLFEQACEAIQHAHLKGIVHRDITPRNILAFQLEGEEPKLKVIDFGLAKAMGPRLGDRSLHTQSTWAVGTPAYMSPEQANPGSSDIDTRSDIYSLGVLLYELLAGVTPVDVQEVNLEVLRELAERDPPAPSVRLSGIMSSDRVLASRIEASRGVKSQELVRRLRGELEWIPLKAMRKERQHRYQTALEFANDVRAYLDGRPLLAGPESTAYRVRKYVRRNRALVAGAGAVLMALVVGLGLATWQWFQAEREREAASQALAFLGSFLSPVQENADSQSVLLNDLIREARWRVDEHFGTRDEAAAVVCMLLSESAISIGDFDAAKELAAEGVRRAEAAERVDVRSRCEQVVIEAGYRTGLDGGTIEQIQGRLAELDRGSLGRRSEDAMRLRSQLAGRLKWDGRFDEAENEYRTVIEDRSATSGPRTFEILSLRHDVNLIDLQRARAARRAGRSDEADTLMRVALNERQRLCADAASCLRADHWLVLWSDAERLGMLAESGQAPEAVRLYPGLIARLQSVLGPMNWRTIETKARFGKALALAGDGQGSATVLMDALDAYRLVRPAHRDTWYATDLLVKQLESVGDKELARFVLERSCRDADSMATPPDGPASNERAKARRAALEAFLSRQAGSAGPPVNGGDASSP
jgi:non-specific serine/threonine protein kinase/serine/threonine-protein kinase